MTESRLYKPFLLLLALAMLVTSGITQKALNEERTAMGLTRTEPLENAPPMLAFTTVALGGFRGLIANALWLRANDMQQNGKYFEMVQLSDWITKLQPHFAMVWRHQAWNMSYNISIKFPDQKERWMWVVRAIELLRDEGLRFNPHEVQLYHELGWTFQNKIGGNMDDGHMYYKLSWAYEMDQIVGRPPYNFENLINPKTPEDEATRKTLKETYKMDPAYMQSVENIYGPLDWRMPETQAIYWAYTGMQKAGRGMDLMPLRRLIYQSMQLAFHRGRLVLNVADGRADFAPNVDIVEKVSASYAQMLKEEKNLENIQQGHQNFLKSAVSTLYLYNREAESAKYWAELKRLYPATVEDWKTAEEYSIWRTTELLANEGGEKYLAVIEGLLVRSYTLLAVGEYDRAAGYERMAQKVWQSHQIKVDVDTKEEIKARIQLPPYATIKNRILNDILNPDKRLMSAGLALQLRTELGLPMPASAAGQKNQDAEMELYNPEVMRKLPAQQYMAQNAKRPGMVVLPSGVQYRVIEKGDGPKPRPGLKTHIHHWEQTSTGKKIINTYTVVPAPAVDIGKFVKGLQEVIPMMNQGSKWHVYVPPALAYGEKGVSPNIPPNSVMVYEVHLVEVK
ncbi:MAG TPA: FKBP-type peptidyl-prolyl cis-trans isomerase [Verrucomicrobiae bacterium]